MHIHKGAAGAAGPVVVPLGTPNSALTASGCAPTARALVAAMLAAPASFYLNIHTAEFAAGAIRGQLTGTSAQSFGWIVAVDLRARANPTPPYESSESARTPAWSATDSTLRTSPFQPAQPTFTPRRRRSKKRASRGPVHRTRRRRQLKRMRHRVAPNPDRRDPRQPGRLLRQRHKQNIQPAQSAPNSAKSPPPDSGPSCGAPRAHDGPAGTQARR